MNTMVLHYWLDFSSLHDSIRRHPAGSKTSHLCSSECKFLLQSLNLRFSFHKTAPARASALQHNLRKRKKGGEALKKWYGSLSPKNTWEVMAVNSGEEALAYKASNLVIILLNENICLKQSNCFNFPTLRKRQQVKHLYLKSIQLLNQRQRDFSRNPQASGSGKIL